MLSNMMKIDMKDTLKIGMAQISPVWLNKQKTIEKIKRLYQESWKC